MRDALKSYLTLAAGLAEVPRQRAVAAAKALVSSGEATAEQVASLAEELIEQTRQNRETVVALVGAEVDRALGRVGLAREEEVVALTERVRTLEAEARRATPPAAAPPAKKSAAAAAPAKKAPAKKAPAKKAPAKKAPAKKATEAAAAEQQAAQQALHAKAEAERGAAPASGPPATPNAATVAQTPASPA